MHLKGFTAFLSLLGLSSALRHRNDKRDVSSTTPYVYTGPKVPSYNFSMPVDHFNKADNRTYNNRYFVNDTYYKPGGPVFLFDYGEQGFTEESVAEWLAEVGTNSSVMKLAARHNGVAIGWEHRYYGKSFPIPLNKTTHEPCGGVSGYKYLNVEQALEDVVYFAKNWKPKGCNGDACNALSPSRTPWIWVGGSYPGMRGAYLRIRNPEVIYAVWSSSAPVEAMYDGSVYFAPLQASLPTNCSNDIQAVVKYADEVMAGNHGADAFQSLQRLAYVTASTRNGLNQTYTLSSASKLQPSNIGQMMAEMFWQFQETGPSYITSRFCDNLQTYNPKGKSSFTNNTAIAVLSNLGDANATAKGVAATYGAPTALNAYFFALRRYNYAAYISSLSNTRRSEAKPDAIADQKSWSYQTLTEFGWFQGSNPANVTIISKFYNYTVEQLNRAAEFPDAEDDTFPDVPDIKALNKYGGWDMKPSNIMFTDGEFDPWRGGSPMAQMAWNDAPLRNVVQVVPQCNTPPQGSDVFGLIYPGEVHVPDLGQGSRLPYDRTSPVYNGVQLFSRALDTWLPCFKRS